MMKAVLLGIVTACALSLAAFVLLGPITLSSDEAFANPDSVRID